MVVRFVFVIRVKNKTLAEKHYHVCVLTFTLLQVFSRGAQDSKSRTRMRPDEARLLQLRERYGEDSKASLPSHKSAVPLWMIMATYVGTALMQPTFTDRIRYSGGAGHIGWPPTVLNQLANVLSMTFVGLFVCGRLLSTFFGGSTTEGAMSAMLMTAFIDLISGVLVTTGLLSE